VIIQFLGALFLLTTTAYAQSAPVRKDRPGSGQAPDDNPGGADSDPVKVVLFNVRNDS